MFKYLEKLPDHGEVKNLEIGPITLTVRDWRSCYGIQEIKALFHMICLAENWGQRLVPEDLVDSEGGEDFIVLGRNYVLGNKVLFSVVFPTRKSVILEFLGSGDEKELQSEPITFTIKGLFPLAQWSAALAMITVLGEPSVWGGKEYIFNKRYVYDGSVGGKVDDPFYLTLYEDRSVTIDFGAVIEIARTTVVGKALENLLKKGSGKK